MKKNILIAPLNWGLGHATRCIPIINALKEHDFEPIIASDGAALELLIKEFPELQTFELPSYNITYSVKGSNFKWKLLFQMPKMFRAIHKERKIIEKIIEDNAIQGVISDNRLGVFSKKVPSVFITHQLQVLSGTTSFLTTFIHKLYIKKYRSCWVPDVDKTPNLSGKLGHLKETIDNIFYIGPISRLHKKELPKKYDVMVILSGPEPQRTMLENRLILELKTAPKKILFIKGIIENEQRIWQEKSITFVNFMNAEQLENAFNESEILICRSGYTTVMDISKLGKKVFFIPTPGQYEQEYLAQKFESEGIAPFCNQDNFKISKLERVPLYKGFTHLKFETPWKKMFKVFE